MHDIKSVCTSVLPGALYAVILYFFYEVVEHLFPSASFSPPFNLNSTLPPWLILLPRAYLDRYQITAHCTSHASFAVSATVCQQYSSIAYSNLNYRSHSCSGCTHVAIGRSIAS